MLRRNPTTRRAAAVAVALCLSPAWLWAQTTVLTVNAPSADVYQGPSTAMPVIGHASNGAVLLVTRELGSWVKVPWPGAQDGVGYVHVSKGLVGRGSPSDPIRPTGLTTPPSTLNTAALTMAAVPVQRPVPAGPPMTMPLRPVYVTPATHAIGLGGHAGGPTLGFGASVRVWNRKRFGSQFEVSRSSATSAAEQGVDVAPERVTSTQFEPSLLYSPTSYVTDYVWVRPYVGSGVNFRRQTLSSTVADGQSSVSENRFGVQLFGGGELAFASMPRFALSVDAGYHGPRTTIAGVDLGGLGASISGHWYVK